jgi:hypothetical protein
MMFQTKFAEKIKTHSSRPVTFSRKLQGLRKCVKIWRSRRGHRRQSNAYYFYAKNGYANAYEEVSYTHTACLVLSSCTHLQHRKVGLPKENAYLGNYSERRQAI